MSDASQNRPNILLILTDQWHPNCTGFAGHPIVRTPHLDKLASGGMIFSRMYTPCPLCMPARASIFTGQSPRGHGVRTNGIPLDPSFPTVVESIRRNGYHTHNAGKIHLHVGNKPKGTDIDGLRASDFPECRGLWESGRLDSIPLPYYGFQSVDYGNGHGHRIFGEYRNWLKSADPEAYRKLLEPTMLEAPTGAFKLFNRVSFKWALPAEYHPTTWTIDRSIEFLRKRQGRNSTSGEKPFFLVCNINDPHPPFCPPAEYAGLYDPGDVPDPVGRNGELDDMPPHFREMRYGNLFTSGNPGEPMAATDPYYRECAAHYYGQIQLIDDQVGSLLAELNSLGLTEDTLVLFTADHGECLGDHGFWGKGPYHYDGVIRVPFVASWPGRIKAGSVCDSPTSLIDLAPTFLEVTGTRFQPDRPVDPPEAASAPPVMPGTSLKHYWDEPDKASDRCVLVELDEDYLNLKLRTIVTPRYRMTAYPGQSFGELFDLENDPAELYNLWNRGGVQKLKTELSVKLLELLTTTEKNFPRQLCRS